MGKIFCFMNFKFLVKKSIFLSLILSSFVPAKAAILTIPLNYTTEASVNNINDDLTLSGELLIDTDLDLNDERFTQYSLRAFDATRRTIPDWVLEVTLEVVDSDPTPANGVDQNGDLTATYTKSDFDFWVWKPTVDGTVDFSQDLVPQFDDIGFIGNFGMTSNSPNIQDIGDPEFILTSTPLPVPFIGFFSFLYYARKLKKYSL